MPFNLGFTEILVIVVFALLLFGPRKMGTIAKSLGRAYFEFKHEFNKLNSTLMTDLKSNITNDPPKGYKASDPYPPDTPPYEYPSYDSVKDEEPEKDTESETAKAEEAVEVKKDEPESEPATAETEDKKVEPPTTPPADSLAG